MKVVGKGDEEGPEGNWRAYGQYRNIVRSQGLHMCHQESSKVFPIIPPLCPSASERVTTLCWRATLLFFSVLSTSPPGQVQALDWSVVSQLLHSHILLWRWLVEGPPSVRPSGMPSLPPFSPEFIYTHLLGSHPPIPGFVISNHFSDSLEFDFDCPHFPRWIYPWS